MHPSFSAEQLLSPDLKNDVVAKEIAYGNGDLIKALKLSGITGPYHVLDPWRLKEANGDIKINAGGYSALPFGDKYPALTDFAIRYLQNDKNVGLPQQSCTKWRAELESRLVRLVARFEPDHADSQVFFSNSGAETIESAIKFAMSYRPKAKYFINFSRAYHGKTLGALSLTPNAQSAACFGQMPFGVITLPFGDPDRFEQEVKRIGAHKIISVILEPIQGEAGVVVPEINALAKIDAICKKHGILVIADEIQTGLGRSGYWFASIEWAGMKPDIITLAKGLGGGLTAVGATIVRRKIYRKMLGGMDSKKQSNTFGGNSLAMAIALKSLDILEEENLVERAKMLGEKGQERLNQIVKKHPKLFEKSTAFGMMFSTSFHPVSPTKTLYGPQRIMKEFTGLLGLMMYHQGGVLANFSLNSLRTIRLTPALTMPEPLFDEMFDRIDNAAEIYKSSWRLFLKTPPKTTMDLAKFALLG